MNKKPTLRQLTLEGRFESGLDARVAGKRYAFIAVIGESYVAALGAAIEDEPGYVPIPEVWAHADSMLEMQQHADRLNSAMGLNDRAAAELVATTFAAGKVDRPQDDAAARRRLAARRATRARPNPSLAAIFDKPPPLGSVITFTDHTPCPPEGEAAKLKAWARSNGSGKLVAVQRSRGTLTIQLALEGADQLRSFDLSSELAFSVKHSRSSRAPFNVYELPAAQRRRIRELHRSAAS